MGHSAANQIEMMSQAMIRGVMDESGEQFVAYFLPTEETMEKRAKDFTEGKDYDDEQVCANFFRNGMLRHSLATLEAPLSLYLSGVVLFLPLQQCVPYVV